MYKYAVIIPAIDKNQKIRNPGPVIIEIDQLPTYSNGAPMRMNSKQEHDLTKKKTLVYKERSVKGHIETPNSREAILRLHPWHGTNNVAIFKTFAEAVEYKIKATKHCIQVVEDSIAKQTRLWKEQAEAISGSIDNLMDKHPEMFL